MRRQDEKVLITGGAGYIGSVLVRLLLSRGWQVRVLDRIDFGPESLQEHESNDSFNLVIGDLRDGAVVQKALDGVTHIVHLAAIVGEPACNRDPSQARDINSNGSKLVCDLAVKAGVRNFVFSSTCSNYRAPSVNDSFVDESAELQPLSVYSETKVGFENYLLATSQNDFCPTVLRFATAYGLSPRPRFDLTVNEFTRELLLNRKLEVYGEDFWRPYCHTEDIASACAGVLEAEDSLVSHQAFNVGSTDENYQKKTLVALIDHEVPGAATLVTRTDQAVDLRNYRVSFEKIKELLDFKPTKTVPDGIREIIEAIRSGTIADPDSRNYHNV